MSYLTENIQPFELELEKERIRDVLDIIKDIRYGFISKVDGKIITDRDWIQNCDLDKYYEVNTDPLITLQNKLGICQDQAIAIKYLMNKFHPEDNVILFGLVKQPAGHCVPCYCHDGKWYYIENSWDKEKGLHGYFESKDELKKYLKFMYYTNHKDDTPVDSPVQVTNYESLLEDTRTQFVAKSRNVDTYKHNVRGKNRWERKKFSKVSQQTQKFNTINMNDFFKKDLLQVKIPVTGETEEYIVTIQMDGVVAELARNIKSNHNIFEYKTIIQALTKVFNTGNLRVKCECKDFLFRYAHNLIINNNSVDGTDKDPGPGRTGMTAEHKGQGCKHILLCLANQDWLMKIANVIKNYIMYMAEHKKALFNKFIFPKLYGIEASDAIEDELVPEDTNMDTDKNIIDTINTWARNRGKFKKGENKNSAVGKGKLTGPKEKEPEKEPEDKDTMKEKTKATVEHEKTDKTEKTSNK